MGRQDTTNVLVLMGGASGEHAISLRSAATITAALAEAGHTALPVAIDRAGIWRWGDYSALLERARAEIVEVSPKGGVPVALVNRDGRGALVGLGHGDDPQLPPIPSIDVVFPVLHGPGGEDGSVQGMLETLRIPFVGAGCGASALAMDKLSMKLLCSGAGVPQVEYIHAGSDGAEELTGRIEASFGFPCFVKPARLGSSVGITRVAHPDALGCALDDARQWDHRLIIERAVDAREIEIAMIGGVDPEFSPPGEIIARGGFYDFSSKYLGNDAELVAPASVERPVLDTIRDIAHRIWSLISCHGLARADFFIERRSGTVFFNEINTIPGFTEISMFPRLWKCAGVPLPTLVNRLVRLAFENNQR